MYIKKGFVTGFLLSFGALIIRLLSLFFITPIDFRWESYHYWQIAIYTLRVGLSQGRMWDLGGMEYFWGPLPILTQSFLLWIFNTTSMLPFRILDVIVGSLTTYLAYLVGKRHFNERVGILSAALVMLNPLLVFNSVIGMEETMGVFFVLLALSFYRRSDYLLGVFLALASLCRIEFWLLSLGISFYFLLFERNSTPFIMSIIGWLTLMTPYFLFIRGATGNPFYAFYWNFIGNIAGIWTPWYIDPLVRGMFTLILIGAVTGLFLVYRYRKSLGNYILYVVFLGFAAYHGLAYALSGVAPLFDRFFLLDAAIGSIVLSRFITRLPKQKAIGIGTCLLVGLSAVSVAPYYVQSQSDIIGLYSVADVLGESYEGGTVLCNVPAMTYHLIDYWHLPHESILGTLYAPLDNVTEALLWLKGHNATWLVVAEPKAQQMVDFFSQYSLTYDLFESIFEYSGAEICKVNKPLIDRALQQLR